MRSQIFLLDRSKIIWTEFGDSQVFLVENDFNDIFLEESAQTIQFSFVLSFGITGEMY